MLDGFKNFCKVSSTVRKIITSFKHSSPIFQKIKFFPGQSLWFRKDSELFLRDSESSRGPLGGVSDSFLKILLSGRYFGPFGCTYPYFTYKTAFFTLETRTCMCLMYSPYIPINMDSDRYNMGL